MAIEILVSAGPVQALGTHRPTWELAIELDEVEITGDLDKRSFSSMIGMGMDSIENGGGLDAVSFKTTFKKFLNERDQTKFDSCWQL